MDHLEDSWRQAFEPDLVSVIIPTYNRAHVLGNAIRSALAQQEARLEIIIVDDGSNDDTASLLAQFTGLKVIRQENQGVGAARNAGLKVATGEFIASLDSDDVWHSNFVATMLSAMREHKCMVGVAARERKINGVLVPIRDTPMEKKYVGGTAGFIVLTASELRSVSMASVLCTNPGVVFHRSVVEPWHTHVRSIDELGQHARVIFRHAPQAVYFTTPLWEAAPLGQDAISVAGRNDRFDLGWRIYRALGAVQRENWAQLTPVERKQFARKRSDWLIGDSAYPMSMHGRVGQAFIAYAYALFTDFRSRRVRELAGGVARSLRTLLSK